jgi:hypothetical protein
MILPSHSYVVKLGMVMYPVSFGKCPVDGASMFLT